MDLAVRHVYDCKMDFIMNRLKEQWYSSSSQSSSIAYVLRASNLMGYHTIRYINSVPKLEIPYSKETESFPSSKVQYHPVLPRLISFPPPLSPPTCFQPHAVC